MKKQELRDDREQMIRLLERRGIIDEGVLTAMRKVPRERFVAPAHRPVAYADRALPLQHGATLSQPYVVAFMTQAARLSAGKRVLEIGTGSGYQAAVLASMGCEVYSVEIVAALTQAARDILDALGFGKVQLRTDDGYQGWSEAAPFDAILVTAAAPHVPKPLLAQLAEGGRLVIPVGERWGDQVLEIHQRHGDAFEVSRAFPVRFVPMTGEAESSLH